VKSGKWVPISKFFTKFLPLSREFTELEAAFSLQVDYDVSNDATIAGYASRWRWSRGRVSRFLERMGVNISYEKSTKNKQNQRGQIVIQITDRSRTDNGQIRLIDSNKIKCETDRSRTDSGQITDRSQGATKDPNTKPNTKTKDYTEKFLLFWEKYPNKKGKAKAFISWKKYNCENGIFDNILESLENHKNSDQWKKDNGQYIPHCSTWVNGKGWEDEVRVNHISEWGP